MRRLLVVRHGDYVGDHLSEYGQRQMSGLCDKLKPTVNGGRVVILTSTAGRARESAEIVAKVFGAEVEPCELLWSEAGRRENLEGALELVRSKKDGVDILILVTHHEYTQRFPAYFDDKELGAMPPFLRQSITKGEAWDIDCDEKTIARVR